HGRHEQGEAQDSREINKRRGGERILKRPPSQPRRPVPRGREGEKEDHDDDLQLEDASYTHVLLLLPRSRQRSRRSPAEQERVGALVDLVQERPGLLIPERRGPSAALEFAAAVLV